MANKFFVDSFDLGAADEMDAERLLGTQSRVGEFGGALSQSP